MRCGAEKEVKMLIEIYVKAKKKSGPPSYNILWGEGWTGIRFVGRRPYIAPRITWRSLANVTKCDNLIWWDVMSDVGGMTALDHAALGKDTFKE